MSPLVVQVVLPASTSSIVDEAGTSTTLMKGATSNAPAGAPGAASRVTGSSRFFLPVKEASSAISTEPVAGREHAHVAEAHRRARRGR